MERRATRTVARMATPMPMNIHTFWRLDRDLAGELRSTPQDLHLNRVYGLTVPHFGHFVPTNSGRRRTRSQRVPDLLPILTGRIALHARQ